MAVRATLRRPEIGAFVFLALTALGTRLWFVTAYPTTPTSDFRNVVRFAEAFAADGFATGFEGWQFFNPGVPLALSLVLRVVPGDPAAVARYTTATVTGLAALCPFVLWRGAFPLRARFLASLLLALWPGHVCGSGIVSQDNWALLPTLALASLAVRVVARGEPGWPIASALLWAAAGMTRQEMLVVLAPFALASAGLLGGPPRGRALAVTAVVAALALTAMAGLRWAGSGSFRVSTTHGGTSVLGAYGPGAASTYWSFPQAAAAALAPHLVHNWEGLRDQALRLAIHEALRRPRYHLVRIFSAIVNCQVRSDSNALDWALAPEVLPPGARARAEWAPRARAPASAAMIGLFAVYLAIVVVAIARRIWPLLLIAGVMLLKLGLHGVSVAQPRYFVAVTALALLSLGLAAALPECRPSIREWSSAAVIATFVVSALVLGGRRAEAYVLASEEQLVYAFTIQEPSRAGRLRCVVRRGVLARVGRGDATIRTLHVDPAAGETATAECEIESQRDDARLSFEFDDDYPAGGWPGRILQSVEVDGREATKHDLAASPGSERIRIPLETEAGTRPTKVMLTVTAGNPDAGFGWGIAGATPFRLSATYDRQGPAAEVRAASQPFDSPRTALNAPPRVEARVSPPR
ncbi:MAG TPA: hypothetical protein VFK70_19005 [Vicinamibacteria bacterium]|nr:hypothetical protein [Vicinamibacteria bacterium]